MNKYFYKINFSFLCTPSFKMYVDEKFNNHLLVFKYIIFKCIKHMWKYISPLLHNFYVYVNVDLFLHVFVHLYDGQKQVC